MRTTTSGGRVVVHVTGDADVTTAASLRHHLAALIRAGASDIVVDLTQVTFVDSTVIGVLVGMLERIRAGRGRLELALDDARVLRVLRIAGLTEVFTVHASVAGALATDSCDPTGAAVPPARRLRQPGTSRASSAGLHRSPGALSGESAAVRPPRLVESRPRCGGHVCRARA